MQKVTTDILLDYWVSPCTFCCCSRFSKRNWVLTPQFRHRRLRGHHVDPRTSSLLDFSSPFASKFQTGRFGRRGCWPLSSLSARKQKANPTKQSCHMSHLCEASEKSTPFSVINRSKFSEVTLIESYSSISYTNVKLVSPLQDCITLSSATWFQTFNGNLTIVIILLFGQPNSIISFEHKWFERAKSLDKWPRMIHFKSELSEFT